MRYELKNIGPNAFYCVEVAKLVKPGESVLVNQIDEGTRRLAEGPQARLQISGVGQAAHSATAAPPSPAPVAAAPTSSTPAPVLPMPPTNAKPSSSSKTARGAALDVAPRPPAEDHAGAAEKGAVEGAPPAEPTSASTDIIK